MSGLLQVALRYSGTQVGAYWPPDNAHTYARTNLVVGSPGRAFLWGPDGDRRAFAAPNTVIIGLTNPNGSDGVTAVDTLFWHGDVIWSKDDGPQERPDAGITNIRPVPDITANEYRWTAIDGQTAYYNVPLMTWQMAHCIAFDVPVLNGAFMNTMTMRVRHPVDADVSANFVEVAASLPAFNLEPNPPGPPPEPQGMSMQVPRTTLAGLSTRF